MGAIKDIVDLCITLRNESKDGKVAEVVMQIQSFMLALQSEQAAIVEKNTELMHENLNLKQQVFDLQKSVVESHRKLTEKQKHVLDDYVFIAGIGLYQKKDDSNALFCGQCAAEDKMVRVKDCPHGWQCVGCNKYVADPKRPAPHPTIRTHTRNPFFER